MSYTIDRTVDGSFEDVVERVQSELAEEGFGILSDIDVQATLAEKLGKEINRYRILGACDPTLAHEALATEPSIGALLPCNVVVTEDADGTVLVRAVDPVALLSVAENSALEPIGNDVRQRFERVLYRL